ncbi:M48 family metallopeptidase [Aureivirga marina]|uniref:M48 family metallopeptidase n=1 Tax=Aureivirga marina TaxID=1182451 RepID=UPI0018C92988|nr:SprT family zinc-dependent metalloprotease [Aureivirga marina]
MPSVEYGNKTIEYIFQEQKDLNTHYISVEKHTGVVLKGSFLEEEQQKYLILKKARWILNKLALVKSIDTDTIVTGSRMQYLGRKYYVQLILDNDLKKIKISFTESIFQVYLPENLNTQENLQKAFNKFLNAKAVEKITPRVKKWVKKTGLEFQQLKFRKLEKRWGSCTPSNTIILNFDAIQLPYSLIDYLIVHELVHTKIKNHSKEYWAEVAKYIPNFLQLDAKMDDMKL